ncbi:hypothetical protein [Corynebacterium halotolerans]|uniref:Uncharacterized protein n=1 Tax=Corynebacterium halotolerans YIM 70093 = DSM 44683 TaxID=1121362 RepID=M1NY19_9CORY|nr:hypothetical protein [Corynebacterium halotolerans]AGF72395.1 hypothetical protein A605_06965 [Corynebacterium halotolerans YIM 70093 = DSM 44683]
MVADFIDQFRRLWITVGWNLATLLVLGVYGGVVNGQILDPEYLDLLSSGFSSLSSDPYAR